MNTPDIPADAICYGCGDQLFTSQADVNARIESVEKLKTGDDRKWPPNTVRVHCINDACPRPHRAIFIASSAIPDVTLPA